MPVDPPVPEGVVEVPGATGVVIVLTLGAVGAIVEEPGWVAPGVISVLPGVLRLLPGVDSVLPGVVSVLLGVLPGVITPVDGVVELPVERPEGLVPEGVVTEVP